MQALSARMAQEILEEPITEADWIIEDLFPVGAHILAGAPKIGKSWMVLAMGLAVSMGQPFWDYAVCQGAVLYLCLEDTYARAKKRLWKLTDEANDSFYLANSAGLGSGDGRITPRLRQRQAMEGTTRHHVPSLRDLPGPW